MNRAARVPRWLGVALASAWVAGAWVSCAATKSSSNGSHATGTGATATAGTASGGSGGGRGGGEGASASGGSGGGGITLPDSGCTPSTCQMLDATCGPVTDPLCGGVVECGTCP